MKTIGLLGGMTWESTDLYYRWINQCVKAKLGGLHSARIAMVSVDFQEIAELQHSDNWNRAGEILSEAARHVEAAGADFLVICANTMHKVAPQIERAINIPILHVADATARRIKEQRMKTVGLLGTSFTMEQDFYRGRLSDEHELTVIIPSESDRQIVNSVIYTELCHGIVDDDSREQFLEIIDRLSRRGAEGVIEGCTEIVLLVQQEHTNIPLFDTTAIHAQEAVSVALA